MSNRFHNKFHRFNHHSAGTPDPKYPDAAYDPIASYDSPFQGEFFSQGTIVTTQDLSAGTDLAVNNNATIKNNLSVGYDVEIGSDLVVQKNFTVNGEYTNINTLVYITSAVEIVNAGTGPALRVEQMSSLTGEPIAHFLYSGTSSFIVDGTQDTPGYVGINTSTPNERLTIVGNTSAVGDTFTTGNVYVSGNQLIGGSLQVGNIQTGATNDILTLSGNLVETRLINPRVWDTTAEFLSHPNNLSVNYLPKYTGLTTLNNSTIRDELTSVIINSNVIIQGTITALGSASFVNTKFTTTSSISVVNFGEGPALYVYQAAGPHDVASFYDGDGIEVLHVGNANVGGLGRIGINESNPNTELTVNGSISASGTLNIGSVVTGSISATRDIITQGIIKPGTVFVTPQLITILSLSGNDVEFAGHSTTVTITSFTNGTKGATYTLTNKETFAVTISSSPTVYVRGGSNWFSNSSNPKYSSIVLLSGYSCSLRAGSADVVSVW